MHYYSPELTQGRTYIVRYLNIYKAIFKSKLLMEDLGYLIVSVQVLAVTNMGTTKTNMPEGLPRMMTSTTYVRFCYNLYPNFGNLLLTAITLHVMI